MRFTLFLDLQPPLPHHPALRFPAGEEVHPFRLIPGVLALNPEVGSELFALGTVRCEISDLHLCCFPEGDTASTQNRADELGLVGPTRQPRRDVASGLPFIPVTLSDVARHYSTTSSSTVLTNETPLVGTSDDVAASSLSTRNSTENGCKITARMVCTTPSIWKRSLTWKSFAGFVVIALFLDS